MGMHDSMTIAERRKISDKAELIPDKNEIVDYSFMNYTEALNKVVRKWYEQRIQEETEKNTKLKELHENLTKIKIEQQTKMMNATIEDQQMMGGAQ